MSERALLLALAAALLLPPPLASQSTRPAPAAQASRGEPDSTAILRALLARVDAQLGEREDSRREEARRSPPKPGMVRVEGRLAVVLGPGEPADSLATALQAADSALRQFDVIPAGYLESIVQVQPGEYDTAATLAAPQVRERHRLILGWRRWDGRRWGPWPVAEPIAEAFRATLHPSWRTWLPRNFGIAWNTEDDGEEAIDELALATGYATGSECLAGHRRSCRLWLGLNDERAAYETRYRPQELVAAMRGRDAGRSPDDEACRAGNGDACARLFQQSGWAPLATIPAPDHARAGLVRELRERHGAEAVRKALADTTGTIGERLARAAGISEDSLVGEWRRWVLSRGHTERVAAGLGDFGSALLFAMLLIGMATRSGRWR